MPVKAETLLHPTREGLFCPPGNFHIDPQLPVDKALITHAHSDHARSGHGAVLASRQTCEIMQLRLGATSAGSFQHAELGQCITINGVNVSFFPAGHVLGSCQIVLEYEGCRICVSGDYKRTPDPTALPFEPQPCDVFVTEATFGLPVFVHPSPEMELAKLLQSMADNPRSDHFVGAYSLGKTQRLIALLRQLGYDRKILLHGSMVSICGYYQQSGIDLGDLESLIESGSRKGQSGAVVIGPPSAMGTSWINRLASPVFAYASGWMRIRQRAKRAGVELPLVLSDHCDWPELQRSIRETGAHEIWVTHGEEDALVHWSRTIGLAARPLRLVGFAEEGD